MNQTIQYSQDLINQAWAQCTDAQYELYQWLYGFIYERQHAPSVRDMMRAMDLKSPAPVQQRLNQLKSRGFVSWEPGKARSYKVHVPLHDGFIESGGE